MAIKTINDLIVKLKGSALTAAQIQALDAESSLCKYPAISIQTIRTMGIQMTVTTDASGELAYKVNA